MSAVKCAWLDSLYDGSITRDRVTAFVDELADATVFATPEWYECAAAILPGARKLRVLVLLRDDDIVGYIPCTLGTERVHGVPARTLRLLGYPLNDRVVLPVRPDEHGALSIVVEAFDANTQCDIAILSELSEGNQRDAIAAALQARPSFRSNWRHCARSPRLELPLRDLPALRNAYGRTLRTRLARARRKLAAAGEVAFERHRPTAEETPPLLELARSIESASWKGRDGVGIFGSPSGLRFFRSVAERFAARGWLDFGILRLNGTPISYRFGFRFRDVFYDYNLAFDPAYAHLSPGRILLDDMIASSVEEGLVAVDASRSSEAEPHLLADWTSEAVTHWELWLFRRTLRGQAVHWLRNRVRPLVRSLRRSRLTRRHETSGE